MIIGMFSFALEANQTSVVQFLISVTYLMAFSLIFSGVFQHVFTRWVADRLYESRGDLVLPNLMGVIWISTGVSFVLGLIAAIWLLPGTSNTYRLLMLANFVVLCNLWPVTIFLSSMKSYRRIVVVFALGYLVAIVASIQLRSFGIEGFLMGLLLGHSLLFFSFFYTIIRQYPGNTLIRFDFMKLDQIFPTLIFTGLLFNAAVWADKLIFWFMPETSEPVLGYLRASIIYDIPIFLAYLSIIPGMAVFLVRMETDFSEANERFYNAVRDGDTLERINRFRDDMVLVARNGIYEIIKVQGMTVIMLFLWAEDILSALGISTLYVPLFHIFLVAVSIQLILLAIQNVLFYLDARGINLIICALFLVTNIVFTLVTIELGAAYYGYGYAAATLVSALVGLALLTRKFNGLEYETFMLQGR
eukprot:TRINITY_DN5755_c0_g2_i1.p1 TRINITY_DN5755_c0_g2~~TRINITY_DN5755_c0_g2_i1.p1  ORF type:complete len:417 (+),score=29.74 TRINITY_DN5755_c0_g2_i1:1249-2499(+)